MDRVYDSGNPLPLARPLPGREQEQRELASLLERALHAYGGVALISGEAGIGKTTLSDWLLARADQCGAMTLTGHCYDLTAGQPYSPWTEIQKSATRINPGHRIPQFSPSQATSLSHESQTGFFEHVSSALHDIVSKTPLVLTLEDIHWADSASLELFRYLARQAANLPLLFVATYRDDDPEETETLAEILPELVRESRAHRIELQRLTLSDVEAFLDWTGQPRQDGNPALAEYLHQRAEGNPFFMHELLRDLGTLQTISPNLQSLPVPRLARQVINNRFRRLDDETRRLLNVAAVIGQDVPIDLWRQVAGASEAALLQAVEHAIAGNLMRESPDGASLSFVHGLIQETLYQEQLALHRRTVHQQIAECLENRPVHSAGTIAHHFERAGDERAIQWLVQAAEEAQALYAAQEAIRYIRRAEQFATAAALPLPTRAYRVRALACEMTGELDTARRNYHLILQAARDASDQEAECQALIDLGLHWAARDYKQSGACLEQALAIAEHLHNARLHAHCLNRVGNWHANTGQLESAIRLHQEALQIFERVDDREGIADTIDLLGMTCFLAGEFQESAAYDRRSLAIAREMKDKPRLLTSLTALTLHGGEFVASFDAGITAANDSSFWIASCEEAVTIARDLGMKRDEAYALGMLGRLVSVRGDPGLGLRLTSEAYEIAQAIGHQQWMTTSSMMLGRIWTELLDWHRGEYYLERSRVTAQATRSYFWTVQCTSNLANLWIEMGRHDLAYRLLEPFLPDEATGRSNTQRAFQHTLASWKLANGEAGEALRILEVLLALQEDRSRVRGAPQLLKLKGDALTLQGYFAEAERAYSKALEATHILGFSTLLWKIQTSYGSLLLILGRQTDADNAFAAAEASGVELAQTIHDPDVRKQFLERLRQRISNAREFGEQRSNIAGLSSREIEVLGLVARGLTDAEVGDRLFISPRTVARHLQSIYTKLGVRSRTSATAFAWEQGIVS